MATPTPTEIDMDQHGNSTSRRAFLGTALAAAATPRLERIGARAGIPDGATVLFQGDSVTDNWHVRTITEPNHERALGTGYPLIAASEMLRRHPGADLRFFNRGVSGNRVPDMAARWQADTLALKPDVLSVLIGVNDFWHTMLNGYTGTLESYEAEYVALLESTRKELPAIQLLVMEPFAIEGKFVDGRWSAFAGYQAAARRVAERVGAKFIPLQKLFSEYAAKYGAGKYAWDGVHPTAAGHALIARSWLEAVS